MSQNEVNSILDKLRKLANLKEGAEAVGSYEEAANAAAKFQDLLLKHNLTEKQVMDHGIEKKARMLEKHFDCMEYNIGNSTGWVERLVSAVAHSCLCRVVRLGHTKATKSILGEEHNVLAAVYMTEQLISKISIASSVSWRLYKGAEKKGAFIRGFLLGAVNAICERLHKQEEEIAKPNTEMGLMVIDKRALATRFMMDKYQNLRSARPSSISSSSSDGYGRGVAAGRAMDINKGVSGGIHRKRLN